VMESRSGAEDQEDDILGMLDDGAGRVMMG